MSLKVLEKRGTLAESVDVHINGCYRYRGLPFLRVTLIDVVKARNMVTDGELDKSVVDDARRAGGNGEVDQQKLTINLKSSTPEKSANIVMIIIFKIMLIFVRC